MLKLNYDTDQLISVMLVSLFWLKLLTNRRSLHSSEQLY